LHNAVLDFIVFCLPFARIWIFCILSPANVMVQEKDL
jgi:hypothetical protein